VLATASDGKVRIWDSQTGKLAVPPMTHQDGITAVEFSPDGARLLTASDDRTARIWDVRSGAPLTPPLKHEGAVTSAHFSPDGSRIVTSSGYRAVGSALDFQAGGYAQVWDAGTGLPVGTRLMHEKAVRWAAFSPDGTEVVTASDDGTARVWDTATSTAVTPSLKSDAPVIFAAFSPEGGRILTVAAGEVRVWQAPERPGPQLIHAACLTLAATGSVILSENVRLDTLTAADGGPCQRYGLLSPSFYLDAIDALWRDVKQRL
jgi:WD40 repeat protein